jgi:hypothetical protein
MRTDVTFACEQFQVSERWACKLMGVHLSSYRYEFSRGGRCRTGTWRVSTVGCEMSV